MSSQPATSSTSSPTTMSVLLRTDSPPSAHERPSHLDNVTQENSDIAANAESLSSPRRPLRIYTRPQLLSLSQSPMVKPPPDMPDLRTWFGVENENLVNKKDEPAVPNSARERRFRRDAEDADTSSRPTFRSALQPSQMGNFKHQSLRDRDREAEKERDKDGHERLRHLSDKFDRDRLLPLSGSRNKDREPATHVNTSTRSQPAPPPNGISRRADARESVKKKVGEATEDWRRGGETPRSAREDRPENSRRDRDDRNRDRERARSRHRDSSRSKRETSSSRRDRDRDEDDDGRHWRDDGKRDERMAARRERERARGQERESDDRRWPPGEDRDGGRYKRNTGRERKTGDDTKEKEDRQKEKEPAWMDTYIPSESTSGILGGQDPNGKLDGIQAWKKDIRDKETSTTAVGLSKTISEPISSTSDFVDNHLDEIQIFRLLMKKEEEKKRLEDNATVLASEASRSSNDDDKTRQRNTSTDDLTTNVPSVQSKPSLTSLSSSASIHVSPTPPFNPKDPAVLTSVKVNQDSLHDRVIGPARAPIAESNSVAATNSPSELGGSAFPPVGSRVLAMKNKATSAVNPASGLQGLNGLQNAMPESLQIFSKNEALRPHGAFSPFDDPNRPSYLDDPRDLSLPPNQATGPQRQPVDQLFHSSTNLQTDANYNSLSKGSRLAKIFENKSRDMPAVTSKPLHTSHIPPVSNQTQRQEMNNLGANPVHSVEELMAMLNNSSQRNNLGLQSNPHHNLNNGVPGLLPLQRQQVLQQQQPPTNRLESLYESRTEDRSFVPDGMVPGLRTAAPPPRREILGHFNDSLDESLPYNLQRLTQQPQVRGGLEQLFNNPVTPLFTQQIGRPGSGIPLQPLQQNQYRGGSSPALNTTTSAPQRLPPGLANLGGRPPHDPSQYLGLQQNLPSLGPQHGIYASNTIPQHQLPFNGYNVSNAVGLSNGPSRLPGQNNLLQNSASQQFNLGHHGLDPRLSNHHHLMGIGGSGITGNRINGGFPPQQVPNGPNHVGVRPQQQQLLPHVLPQLMPPHMQQGHPSSNAQQNHDLMAVLMGAPHRE